MILIGLAPLSHTKSIDIDKPPSERARRDAEKVFSWIKITDVKSVPATQKPQQPKQPQVQPSSAKKPVTSPQITSNEPVRHQQAPAPAASAAGAPVLAPANNVPLPNFPPPSTANAASAKVVDEEPIKLIGVSQPKPSIPNDVIEQIKKMSIDVRFVVLPSGAVSNVQVLNNKNPKVTIPIIRAITNWKFLPIARSQIAEVTIAIENQE